MNTQIQSFLSYVENTSKPAKKVVSGVEFFSNGNDQLWSKTFTLKEFFESVGALPVFTEKGFIAGRISGCLQSGITEDDIISNPQGFGVSLFLSTEHVGDGSEVIIPMIHRVGNLKKSRITSFDQLS
jgi:hypothetical protein